jgi:hypothetical protein
MAFKLIPYSDNLDLSEFYSIAKNKGFVNNSTKKMLVDSLSNEEKFQVWMLMWDGRVIGSSAAHTFPEMGADSFRIACRICTFTDCLPKEYQMVRTRDTIRYHQTTTQQFFQPAGINWAGIGKNYYVTTNKNTDGTQRLVHSIVAPTLESVGVYTRITDMMYRGTIQTVWRVNADVYFDQLKKVKSWPTYE